MKESYIKEMSAEDLLYIYHSLEDTDIKIWIDGGWAVDALLEKQTRKHQDLDIAVSRDQLDELDGHFASLGYIELKRSEDKIWNRVFTNGTNHEIEVHAFDRNSDGEVISEPYWDGYEEGSLDGMGFINKEKVRCVSLMQLFKTHDKTKRKFKIHDYDDISMLRKKFDK